MLDECPASDANLFPESSGTAGCARPPSWLTSSLPRTQALGRGPHACRPPLSYYLLCPCSVHSPPATALSVVIYVGLKCIYFCTSLYFSIQPRDLVAEAACAHCHPH